MTDGPSIPPPSRSWLGPRGRLILQTGSWSLVAKVAAAANLFGSVPFVLHALGPAGFGAWATLVSLVVLAGFLDFGFGNGTMNLVAAAHGRDQPEEVALVVREGRRTLVRVGLIVAGSAALVAPWLPWYRFLGLPVAMAADSRWAVMAVLLAIALAVPLNLANRVQLGLGRGDRAFRWQAIGQLLSLGLVVLLARTTASLQALTMAAVLTPLIASLANTLDLLRDPAMTPPAVRRPDLARSIRREGALFFMLQVSAVLAFSADLPLISALRGPAEAGTYAIVQRLYSVVPLALGLVWAPLWPVYRQALASGSHAWVIRTLRRSVLSALAVAATGVLILTLGFDRIATHWVQLKVPVGWVLLSGFAAWSVMDAVGTAVSTFLNAASIIRYQVAIAVAFSISCVAAKIAILHSGSMEYLPWATALTYVFAVLVPTSILRRRLVGAALQRSY